MSPIRGESLMGWREYVYKLDIWHVYEHTFIQEGKGVVIPAHKTLVFPIQFAITARFP